MLIPNFDKINYWHLLYTIMESHNLHLNIPQDINIHNFQLHLLRYHRFSIYWC